MTVQHSGPVSVTEWRDKRTVPIISMYHDTRIVIITDKGTAKHISMLDCNQCTGGVHLKAQVLHSYLTERKEIDKWCMMIGFAGF
jgi:hypothetical protein